MCPIRDGRSSRNTQSKFRLLDRLDIKEKTL